MVKVENLMLDDWVEVTEKGKKIPVQVKGLSYKILCGGKIVDPQEVEPIPVTDEILSQIAENTDEGVWRLDFYYFQVWDTTRGKMFHAFSDQMAMEYNLQFATFFHVHELQHVLRVIGRGRLADKIKL